MNTIFLYHVFGLTDLEYTSTKYEDKNIILNVQTSACKPIALAAEANVLSAMVLLFALSVVSPLVANLLFYV